MTHPAGPDLVRRRTAFEHSWPRWTTRTLAGHLEHCATTWPAAIFMEVEGRTWTYAEFDRYARELTDALHHAGVRAGDRIGLLLGNSAELFALYLGVSRIGALVVPLNYLLGPAELAYVIEHAEPALIVLDTEIVGRDVAAVLRDGGMVRHSGPRLVVRRGALAEGEEWTSLAALLADAAGVEAPDAGSTETPCGILYTAGSSGRPKGVLVHGDALLREAYGTARTRGLEPGWATLSALPSFHMFGIAQAVLPVSFVGGTVVLHDRFEPAAQVEIIGSGGVNDIVLVPAMAYRLLDAMAARGGRADLPDWRLGSAFLGGDPVPESEWQRLRDELGAVELTSGFGMTELQGTSFMCPPESSNEALATSIGWPATAGCAGIAELDGQEHAWRLTDLVTAEPVLPGAVGELQYRSPYVPPGYWHVDPGDDPSRTRDGWFRSGDLAHTRPDGSVVFTGRNSDVFRSGGELVAPREVQKTIMQVPGVAAAHVVGVPDPRWTRVGCAWIVPVPGRTVRADDVLAHCRAQLARYKVPKYVFFITDAELPVSGSGKLHTRSLVTMAMERIATGGPAPADGAAT